MPASPLLGADEVVAIEVLVNGAPLPDSALIFSITARQTTSRPGRLKLKADQITGSKCKPGSAIAVKVGYGGGARQFVFQGTVQSVADTVQSDNAFSIIVAEDALEKLGDVMVDKVSLQVKRSDIISQIISEAGLSADVPASTVQESQVLITGRSALEVCMEFAADEGLLLHAEDTKIIFTRADGQPASVLAITYGQDVIHFAGVGPRQVPGQVTYKSWSIGDGALLQAQAAVPQGTLKGVVRQSGNQNQAYLDALAAGAVRELGLMAFSGETSFQGSTLVKVGVRIHMDGQGGGSLDPMNFVPGDYTVTGCTHVIEDGNYVTTVNVGLDQPLPRPLPVPAPFLPAVVSKICQDPDGLGRFRVQLVTIDPEQGVWAFPVSPYNGFYFPHDIGDQVLVSFLMNDPSVLAIVGTLPSKKMAFSYTRVAPADDKPGVGQLAYGQSKLELAPGTGSGVAIASLSTQALKVELRDGGNSDQKISLQGAQAATAEVADGHVRLKTGASLIDVAQTQISSSSPLIQATAQTAMTLNASAGITLDAAVISLNKDALKVI
ncbi:MAG TPA: phage baseplate assembly protein V [Myxococcales bacterium]|jgi:hypothetical protein|nr:phage baseplate assembly protein V [Myxococcales bacterium]